MVFPHMWTKLIQVMRMASPSCKKSMLAMTTRTTTTTTVAAVVIARVPMTVGYFDDPSNKARFMRDILPSLLTFIKIIDIYHFI